MLDRYVCLEDIMSAKRSSNLVLLHLLLHLLLLTILLLLLLQLRIELLLLSELLLLLESSLLARIHVHLVGLHHDSIWLLLHHHSVRLLLHHPVWLLLHHHICIGLVVVGGSDTGCCRYSCVTCILVVVIIS